MYLPHCLTNTFFPFFSNILNWYIMYLHPKCGSAKIKVLDWCIVNVPLQYNQVFIKTPGLILNYFVNIPRGVKDKENDTVTKVPNAETISWPSNLFEGSCHNIHIQEMRGHEFCCQNELLRLLYPLGGEVWVFPIIERHVSPSICDFLHISRCRMSNRLLTKRKVFPQPHKKKNPTSSMNTLDIPRETKRQLQNKTLLRVEGTNNFYCLRQAGVSHFLNNRETNVIENAILDLDWKK